MSTLICVAITIEEGDLCHRGGHEGEGDGCCWYVHCGDGIRLMCIEEVYLQDLIGYGQ